MSTIWLSDLHLDAVKEDFRQKFYSRLSAVILDERTTQLTAPRPSALQGLRISRSVEVSMTG